MQSHSNLTKPRLHPQKRCNRARGQSTAIEPLTHHFLDLIETQQPFHQPNRPNSQTQKLTRTQCNPPQCQSSTNPRVNFHQPTQHAKTPKETKPTETEPKEQTGRPMSLRSAAGRGGAQAMELLQSRCCSCHRHCVRAGTKPLSQ